MDLFAISWLVDDSAVCEKKLRDFCEWFIKDGQQLYQVDERRALLWYLVGESHMVLRPCSQAVAYNFNAARCRHRICNNWGTVQITNLFLKYWHKLFEDLPAPGPEYYRFAAQMHEKEWRVPCLSCLGSEFVKKWLHLVVEARNSGAREDLERRHEEYKEEGRTMLRHMGIGIDPFSELPASGWEDMIQLGFNPNPGPVIIEEQLESEDEDQHTHATTRPATQRQLRALDRRPY